MFKKYFVALTLALSIATLLAGCGGQSSSSTPVPEVIAARAGVYSYLGTQSPGDVWSWTIGQSTYTGTNETAGYYYSGSYTAYASGFNKAVVTASSDPNVPLDGSAIAYFLEYPGTMLIVCAEYENAIVCAAKATTAPAAGQYNFVEIPSSGWSQGSSAYGTVEVTVSNGLYDFNVRSYNLNDIQTGHSYQTGFSFSDGRLAKTGDPLQIFMTPSGAYYGDSGPNSGGFCGATYQSVTLSDVVSKQYRGALFSYDPNSGSSSTTPVGAEPNTSLTNALNGFGFEDVELNTRSSGGVTLQFSAPDASGILSGTMDDAGTITNFKMVISQVSGKYMIFGISQDSSGNPQNMLMIEI